MRRWPEPPNLELINYIQRCEELRLSEPATLP
jgi:hypothetical protein